jgi:GNAT superfamily N-acetyltransferase
MDGELVEVTRTYLELTCPEDFKPCRAIDGVRIERAADCPPSFFRYLYKEVGRRYHWIDRLSWSDEQIRTRLAQAGVSLWVIYCGGVPAGYFELEQHDDGSVEIVYLGLLPEFIGRGLGKYLLSYAVDQAWHMGANRVWLHTCTLDDPAALPNYLKRGFRPFKRETYFTTVMPDEERGWLR